MFFQFGFHIPLHELAWNGVSSIFKLTRSFKIEAILKEDWYALYMFSLEILGHNRGKQFLEVSETSTNELGGVKNVGVENNYLSSTDNFKIT